MELMALGSKGGVLGPEVRAGWLGSPAKSHLHLPALCRTEDGARRGSLQDQPLPSSPIRPSPPSPMGGPQRCSRPPASPRSDPLLGKCPTNTFTLKCHSCMRTTPGRFSPGQGEGEWETLGGRKLAPPPSKSMQMPSTKSGLCVEGGRGEWVPLELGLLLSAPGTGVCSLESDSDSGSSSPKLCDLGPVA